MAVGQKNFESPFMLAFPSLEEYVMYEYIQIQLYIYSKISENVNLKIELKICFS